MKTQPVDISAVVDAAPVSPFQIWILTLVGLTVVIDGIDVQAMGYVAPAIIQAWGINRASLGPVFGAGLLGMLVGSLAFSLLADRIGRRPVLIGATIFFGLSMLTTANVTTLTELMVMRFIGGLGLGAIMPNAMALAGEFSPKRKRITLMMWVSCGFTVGAVLGGLLASAMIPVWGWTSIFYLGGIVPLVLAALMFFQMPESMQFLVLNGRNTAPVAAALRRIDPTLELGAETVYRVREVREAGEPVAQLFREGRARATVLLWIVNFMNLLNLYFLSNWLPTIAKAAGLPVATAVLVGTSLQVGGVIGTLTMGPAIDRFGFYKVLVPAFLVAAVTIFLIGQRDLGLPMLFTVVTITGLCIVGGQPAVNALAGTYYPTSLRSTGIGWSLGIGRIGSIVGPVLGGELLRLNWSNSAIFIVLAVPAVISSVMLILMAFSARSMQADVPSIGATSLSR